MKTKSIKILVLALLLGVGAVMFPSCAAEHEEALENDQEALPGCRGGKCDGFGEEAEQIPDTDMEEDPFESAEVSCGDAYGEALGYYVRAVDASKDRLNHGVCESETGFLWDIADDASRAVMTCGAFRTVIRTSPWAAPLREVLGESLTLRSLTGELLVIKDSIWQNWRGVEEFFEEGLTFWARSEGAYGYSVEVRFGPGGWSCNSSAMTDQGSYYEGQAVWGEHTYDEETGEVGWRTIPATYVITKHAGTESGHRMVTVTREDKTDGFLLKVENFMYFPEYPLPWKNAPIFVLEPVGEESASPKVYSLVTECDA